MKPNGLGKKILLAHGSGGKASKHLIENIFLKKFNSKILGRLNDQGVFHVSEKKIALTTDAYVVDPIFFPGGDIGKLSVNGTINDIAMSGARPLYLSVSFIIEEGFLISDLEKIVNSMSIAAKEGQVEIITGDTKVVPKGSADKIFITTSGVGVINDNIDMDASYAQRGDKIIISGNMGDHGIGILSVREGLNFEAEILSDTAPLSGLVSEILKICTDVHVMRDPTRGGVASTLNEIAEMSDVGIEIYEENIPVKNEVRGACDILGLDPLYVANEGRLVLFLPEAKSDEVLTIMRKHKYGKDAAIIGEVVDKHKKKVYLKTEIGGSRIVDMLSGDQLPRIC